jgi:hypothetical protein
MLRATETAATSPGRVRTRCFNCYGWQGSSPVQKALSHIRW